MYFEHTMRWFGPNDPISLKEIKQSGVDAVVTALHQIPVGEVWKIDEINKRKVIVEANDLSWTVVESLPVHENIKKQKGNYKDLIDNYKTSIRNLAECGIKTITYNFMPVLDWSRTELNCVNQDGSISSKFDSKVFRAFDLFILKRKNAEKEYSSEQIIEAKEYFDRLNKDEIKYLMATVLYGLPGSLEAYTLKEFQKALDEYKHIGDKELRENLYYFVSQIIPTAEELNVNMAIHPDDPPWTLLGLPRVVGNKKDFEQLFAAVDSPSNGITFCTGSLGASIDNDLVEMTKQFSDKIYFAHLRNVSRDKNHNFKEEYHLEGQIDLYSIIKELLLEQKRRNEKNEDNYKLPIRPDHGNLMLPDMNREGIYPGYSLFGRMRALAELRGLELGIIKSLGL